MNNRNLLASVLDRSGLQRLSGRAGRSASVVVFNYHRIGAAEGAPFHRELFSATERQFAEQVRDLTLHSDVIGPADLDDVLTRCRGRFSIITFDGGYRDNYEAAFPVLQAYGATATFFITTGFIDERPLAWWDEIAWMVGNCRRRQLTVVPWLTTPVEVDDRQPHQAVAKLRAVYKSLPGDQGEAFLTALADACGAGRCPREKAEHLWMTWEMIREMRAAGMTIGGHTVTHPVLANLSAKEQRREITTCKRRLERELHRPVTTFSYPVGRPDAFTEETKQAVADAGFDTAFSDYGGSLRPGCVDRFDLPRVAVERHTTPELFRCTLTLPSLFA